MKPDGMLGIKSSLRFSNPFDNISHVFVSTLHSDSKASIFNEKLQQLRSTVVKSHLKISCYIKNVKTTVVVIIVK